MRHFLIVAALISVALLSAAAFALTHATLAAQPNNDCESVSFVCFDDYLGPSCTFVCK